MNDYTRPPPPDITPRQLAIFDQAWPRFSDAEMTRRRAAVEGIMAENDVTHLLMYGAGGRGSAVPWLTDWSVTTEVIGITTPGERDALYIQYFNHVPFAERQIDRADVHWGGASTIATVADELKRRGAAGGRVGVFGRQGRPVPRARFHGCRSGNIDHGAAGQLRMVIGSRRCGPVSRRLG